MYYIISILATALSVLLVSRLMDSVHVKNYTSAIIVAVLISIANAVLKPILSVIFLPLTLITFGLFTFVINAIIIWLVPKVYSDFKVDGFVSALVFSVLLTIVNAIIFWLVPGI